MKEVQSVLSIVSEGLKTLAKGVEAIAEKVDEVAKAQGAVKPERKKPATASKKITRSGLQYNKTTWIVSLKIQLCYNCKITSKLRFI